VVEVRGRAVAGAVEVDDVQPFGAALHPRARGAERVGVVDGLGAEVALAQADGLAAADVDRGVEDHAVAGVPTRSQAALKLASSLSPCREDFSGWNWTPKTFSRATALTKRSP
jgi:hypothetical protein